MIVQNLDNRRDAQRAAVRCPVRWDHRRLEGQPGEVRDLSRTGMFLRPAGGTVRFRPNDVVWGTFNIGGRPRVFSAVVRWRGWSLEHRCVGLGLEFEESSQLTDVELRAIRWPQDENGRPVLRLLRTHSAD